MRGITALLLMLILMMSGCASPSEEAADGAAPAYHSTAPQAENMRASMVESSARPLLESEILAAYERAQLVYGWFDLASLPTGSEIIVLEGEVYHRVEMDGIENVEDLRPYVRSVFSQELADWLLEDESVRFHYCDIDGALYVSGIGRERETGKGASHVETEQLEDTLYSVNVLVDLLDEDRETVVSQESWSFPYAFEEDRWIFTDFRLVY